MPLGLVGDDSYIAALAKFDLDPARGWVDTRIVATDQAGFTFTPLSLLTLTPHKLNIYWRRMIRYEIRPMQMRMIREFARSAPFNQLPEHIESLYAHFRELIILKGRGLKRLASIMACREMHAKIAPDAGR